MSLKIARSVVMAALAAAANFPTSAAALKGNDRSAVVAAVAGQLERQYVFPDAGKNVAEALRKRLANGDYDRYNDGDGLAKRLSQDLQELAGVGHLKVEYSAQTIPEKSAASAKESEAQ